MLKRISIIFGLIILLISATALISCDNKNNGSVNENNKIENETTADIQDNGAEPETKPEKKRRRFLKRHLTDTNLLFY